MKKLLGGRIDLWITSSTAVALTATRLGIDESAYEVAYTAQTYYVYMAFSLATPTVIVKGWQKNLDAMKKDGAYRRIMNSYPEGNQRMTFDSPHN